MSDARILIVEDEGIEALDIQHRLVSLGYSSPDIVSSGEDAIEKVEESHPDLVLMDIMLNGAIDGVTAAGRIQARYDIPIIYLTAYADDDTLQRAKITEPYGYLVKPFKERELHITIDMALYKHKMEKKLRESEKWFSTTLRSIGDAVIATDNGGLVTFMNPVAEGLTGWKLADARGIKLTEVFNIINRDTRRPVDNPAERVLREGVTVGLANHTKLIARNGTESSIDDSAAPIKDDNGNLIGVILVFRDISERERAELELLREKSFADTTIDSLPGVFYLFNEHGKFLRWNKNFEQVTEYSADEMSTLHPVDLFSGSDKQLIAQRIQEVLEKGETTVEANFVTKSGLSIPYCFTGKRLMFDNRPCVVGMGIDISERKLMEDELRDREKELQLVSDAGPTLISYVDADCRYRRANKVYEQWFGRELAEIQGHHVRDVVGEVTWQVIQPNLERALNGVQVACELELLLPKSGKRWSNITYTPDRDESGRVRGIVVHGVDITERKRMEDALKEADRRKDEFLAMLAHELRNPLAPIRNAIQILNLTGPKEPPLQKNRGIIERQVNHMARLLDDLLDVSRITKGKIALKRERLDLRSVALQAVEVAAHTAQGRPLEIKCETPADPLWIDGDQTRLEQVVGNLLGNAIKFTDHGQIVVALGREEGHGAEEPWATVRVRDTGIGIPASVLSRVFDLFAQADQSLDRSRGGLGIGLTMVKNLAEMHGGTVEARSAGAGHGSEFIVRLPLAANGPTETKANPAVTAMPAAGEFPIKVLVVDDNQDATDSLKDLLEMWGYEPRAAYDGPEAVQMATTFVPDVILLDIGLPGMSGYAVARRLRENRSLESVKIIALTGYGQEEDRKMASEAGCDAHLVKPVDLQQLQALLARLLVNA